MYKLIVYKSRVEEYQIELTPEDTVLVSKMDEDETYNYLVDKYYDKVLNPEPDEWSEDTTHMELEED